MCPPHQPPSDFATYLTLRRLCNDNLVMDAHTLDRAKDQSRKYHQILRWLSNSVCSLVGAQAALAQILGWR